MERSRADGTTGRPPVQPASNLRTQHVIVLKDGDPIPEGYKYVVAEGDETVPSGRTQLRGSGDIAPPTTRPKATVEDAVEGADEAKKKRNAKRNLIRNNNRKANTTFAKELKESLATGKPTTVKVTEVKGDLKARWHRAAKEVAYKFLDLRKESWKDYTHHEKAVVHNELNETFKFDPPLDPMSIDKFLSNHLRTSRAVWKAHWKKHGPERRHHNCPEAVWEKLTKKWPTDACQEESATMARRRARVERKSKQGRSSLMERMEAEVSIICRIYVRQMSGVIV